MCIRLRFPLSTYIAIQRITLSAQVTVVPSPSQITIVLSHHPEDMPLVVMGSLPSLFLSHTCDFFFPYSVLSHFTGRIFILLSHHWRGSVNCLLLPAVSIIAMVLTLCLVLSIGFKWPALQVGSVVLVFYATSLVIFSQTSQQASTSLLFSFHYVYSSLSFQQVIPFLCVRQHRCTPRTSCH